MNSIIKPTLKKYERNVFSQFGEDGIINEIIRRINISNGICIEFGAWDGVLFSNTAALWTKGWKGILIEADVKKYEVLKKVCAPYNCLCIQAYIKAEGENSLENILTRNNVDFVSVKMLSIDIDGGEYHILNGLNKLHPDILILEYNPTIPMDLYVVSKESSFFGSSAKALVELAKQKGYRLVAITKTNCIFIDEKLSHYFDDINTTFENLFDSSNLTYLITGYNGNYTFSRQPSFGMTLPFNKNDLEQGNLTFLNHSHIKTRINYLKDKTKSIIKNILGPNNIQLFRYYLSYIVWIVKGKPDPAHMLHKRRVLRNCAKDYMIDTYIETGTAGGGSIIKMAKYFKKLYTIELDPTLYHQGKALGYDYKNIEFLEGDSGFVIKGVLKQLDQPALFWLDAHYSGGNTAKGTLETPIVQELQSILDHKIKKHIIAIDDIREFNGTHDYPTIEDFEKFIKNHSSAYKFRYDSDIMIIEPIDR